LQESVPVNYPTNEASGEWTAAEAGLIDQARALAPMLRERAAMAEEMRRIPDETHAVFRDAGFYRVLQPARYGGLEARLRVERLGALRHRVPCLDSRHVPAPRTGRILESRSGARRRKLFSAGRAEAQP
jgi:alkylation response protein AidB-like acyl-CoA dehydrogenase